MKAAVFLFGLLASLLVGVVLLFTGQPTAVALIAVLLILAASIYGFFADRAILRWLLAGVFVLFIGSGVYGGLGAWTLVQAFGGTDGPVAAADPVALASAQSKVDAIGDSAAFRLELTEDEMTAYVLDALADEEDNPLGNITLDVVDGENGDEGIIAFDAEFKEGGTSADGAVGARLVSGAVEVEVIDVGVGAFQVPGIAEGALEDLIERIADFNQVLVDNRADVQAITIGNDRVVIVGTQASTDLLTADVFLTGFAQQAAGAVNAATPPPERLGPGVINSTSGGSSPFHVALGDSLAANVGVTEARDGYVSRVHNQLQIRDSTDYGLRNFGISGETTGTLIRGSQLDDAINFMVSNEVAYVTIDIGANNLLGHLGSEDCSDSLDNPPCQDRLVNALANYDDDLVVILDAILDAAPDATVIFMQAYNPFSLGLGTGLESQSDNVLSELNGIAATVASERGVLVADAFTPMARTTGVTTHMFDSVPDIHPLPIGFDILAFAIIEALG